MSHGETAPPQFPVQYRTLLSGRYAHLDASGLAGRNPPPSPALKEIFIPLYTQVAAPRIENKREQSSVQHNDPVDLEELLTRRNVLVIEGHPGSGKTTLLKHITYCLAQADGQCPALKPLTGHVPVLVFLKDLKEYFLNLETQNKNGIFPHTGGLAILDWYCQKKLEALLPRQQLHAFLDHERVVLLLDGLDELAEEYRDQVADQLADLQTRFPGNKLVFTGRPHAVTGPVRTRFPDCQFRIENLTPQQITLFVRQWYDHFPPASGRTGRVLADALLNDMQANEATAKLRDNPLMLTAICILYDQIQTNDNPQPLPSQPSGLYQRFIDTLLERRFEREWQKVKRFLQILAWKTHLRRMKKATRLIALEALKQVYPKDVDESDELYQLRMDARFDEIEPRCGLLKQEDGGYEFWQQTFQEYLAAEYIAVVRALEYGAVDAIKDYWDDAWFAKMICFYIGYLSIGSAADANKTVRQALAGPHRARWLLAAEAFKDMPSCLREEETEDLARRKLISVFQTRRKVNCTTLAVAGELLGWLGDPRNLREFVEIPGGVYELEGWNGPVTLSPFKLGKYPVTNQWYAEFVKDGYTDREILENCWSPEGRAWQEKNKILAPQYWNDRTCTCPNAPVTGVSWWEAEAFGNWMTRQRQDGWRYRLPGEAEWQAAAAGRGKRRYPWGEKFHETRCNSDDGGQRIWKPSSVGIFERGRTPNSDHNHAIYDLAGNIWEWCADWYDDYPAGAVTDPAGPPNGSDRVIRGGSWNDSDRVIRGGSWNDTAWDCCAALRSGSHLGIRGNDLGFRLAAGRSGVEPSREE